MVGLSVALAVSLGGTAAAEVPLPSYREALARQRWAEVNELLEDGCSTQRFPVMCAEGTVDRAIAAADAWQRAVTPDAGLEYLVGLANRYGGREREAIRRYERAIALDPERVEAWYDLGEIRMAHGDLAAARTCFDQVAALRDRGEMAWIGPWRLAEVAAIARDAPQFEVHIKEALRRGFSFRQIAGQPNWRQFYADPALQDTLDKLLTVYATPDVRDSLRAPEDPGREE